MSKKKWLTIFYIFALIFVAGLIALLVYINNDSFEMLEDPDSSLKFFFLVSITIIGFMISSVSLILYKTADKFSNINLKTNLEERIKRAFQPFISNSLNEDKPVENEKITCKYCKSRFDKSYDKCPHCGAPPEQKD